MGLSRCTKLQLFHCHAQENTIDNRFPRNEIRILWRINRKQMAASVNVKMVDHLILDGKIGCLGYNNGKILFAALFSPFFWVLYFPMDLASRKIELSECYIQKLKFGHTLQKWRNNGIGTPSMTAATVLTEQSFSNMERRVHEILILGI